MVFKVKLDYLASKSGSQYLFKKGKPLFVGFKCDTALYASLILPCFTWLTCTHSRICCTAMDVLAVHYCGLITLPVFRLFFVALFVSHMMYCNIFEKTLSSKNKNLY